MALLIISELENIKIWIDNLKYNNENIDIRLYPECKNKDDILMIITFNPKNINFNEYKNLKCIASMGAGVENILANKTINNNVIITKIIDDNLIFSMWQYLQTAVMNVVLNNNTYNNAKVWNELAIKDDITIGIMGLGQIGSYIANKLKYDFNVKAYSNSLKNINGVNSYKNDELDLFIKDVDILINIMPYTKSTHNFFDKTFFSKCKKGLYFINVGRGKSVVEEHLNNTINKNHLSGATLDVFVEEPLPKEHMFWKNDKILITPHIASITNPKSATKQIVNNYNNILNNKTIINQINKEKSY